MFIVFYRSDVTSIIMLLYFKSVFSMDVSSDIFYFNTMTDVNFGDQFYEKLNHHETKVLTLIVSNFISRCEINEF
ncbi:hypothetical protein CSW08_05310 [Confluentibacter flavum]|uniref:Uncharacterized protein n=1 Tax=Confluentibacter flavum TaxID=1909700 RepID=A0A2N3HLM8_9FLAO|nr:hypothetical protein CSW08_05310 [Confluentibacter flavum]